MRRSAPLAMFIALLLLIALPAVALAGDPGVAGGCQVVGTSTSGGTVDLTAGGVWHVRSTDHLSVTGTAPTPQDSVVVNALLLGCIRSRS